MKYLITFLILIIMGLSTYIYLNTSKETPIDKPRIIKVQTPNYIVRTDTIYLIKPAIIDTQIIIKKYFEKINFNREIKVDDYSISISDTLYYNTLHLGDAIITKKKRMNYYLGCNYNSFNGLGGGVAVQRNRVIYEMTFYPQTKIIEFGLKYRINK